MVDARGRAQSSARDDSEYRPVSQSDTSSAIEPLDIEDGRKRVASVSTLRIVLATLMYCISGPSVIFLNKYILVEADFPYGSALSMMGVGMSTVVSGGALLAGVASSERVAAITPQFYMTRVAPIGMALGLGLATGNEAYLFNSLAFVQILKAFAPVVLLLLLFATRLERPSTVLVLSILVISGGTAVAVKGEMDVSIFGTYLMLLSMFFEAVKLIMMQILLVDKEYSAVEGMAVIAPAAIVALLVTTLLLEDYEDAARKACARPLLFLAASLGGVAVNLATNFMVAATSALTLRIASLVRNVGIIGFSAFIVHDSAISPMEEFGFTLSMCGMALYQHARRHPGATLSSAAHDISNCARMRTPAPPRARDPGS